MPEVNAYNEVVGFFLAGGFKYFLFLYGEDSILTKIFDMGGSTTNSYFFGEETYWMPPGFVAGATSYSTSTRTLEGQFGCGKAGIFLRRPGGCCMGRIFL